MLGHNLSHSFCLFFFVKMKFIIIDIVLLLLGEFFNNVDGRHPSRPKILNTAEIRQAMLDMGYGQQQYDYYDNAGEEQQQQHVSSSLQQTGHPDMNQYDYYDYNEQHDPHATTPSAQQQQQTGQQNGGEVKAAPELKKAKMRLLRPSFWTEENGGEVQAAPELNKAKMRLLRPPLLTEENGGKVQAAPELNKAKMRLLRPPLLTEENGGEVQAAPELNQAGMQLHRPSFVDQMPSSAQQQTGHADAYDYYDNTPEELEEYDKAGEHFYPDYDVLNEAQQPQQQTGHPHMREENGRAKMQLHRPSFVEQMPSSSQQQAGHGDAFDYSDITPAQQAQPQTRHPHRPPQQNSPSLFFDKMQKQWGGVNPPMMGFFG